MSVRVHAEIILQPGHALPAEDIAATVTADLSTTQVVEKAIRVTRVSHLSLQSHGVPVYSVLATFWAANRHEAQAAVERAGRALQVPFDTILRSVRDDH